MVVPPWSLTSTVHFDEEGRQSFRERHNLSEKFVVMYAGNHSPCHPLETLLEAARHLPNAKRLSSASSAAAANRESAGFCDRAPVA